MTHLADTVFTTPEMAAVFSDAASVQRMLDVEAALARAQARADVIPQAAAGAITACCRAELFDIDAVYREAAGAGTPVLPLVRRLTELVGEDARGFVHWGATSQDVIDTAVVLQMRDGLDILTGRLADVAAQCAALAERHRRTPMAGRTLLQHAVPITFGLKAARWLAMAARLVQRLRGLRDRALVVQLGGAAGTLAALGDSGVRVMELLAEELGLGIPEVPWHAERDRIMDVATVLGTVAAAMAKVATDITLLSQTEVGEALPAVVGRSSAMPHKRNPVDAINAVACARLATGVVPAILSAAVQEHERAAGGWQAERRALPELFRLTAGAVECVHRALAGLEVDGDRMRANIELSRGLIMAEALTMALAPRLGRNEAHRVVQHVSDRAAQTGTHLREAAAVDPEVQAVLSVGELDRALDVSGYLGSTDALIDRALLAFRAVRPHPREALP